MLSFKSFLIEEAKQNKHITHVEDRPLQSGEVGFHQAVDSLLGAHKHIKAKKHTSELSTKFDGSPSIIYGRHPETKQFFVATKSAFNKNPKINYTEHDVDRNHGNTPNLAGKLKYALRHLPKISPKAGVYQGDFMYGKDETLKEDVTMAPNFSGLTYVPKGQDVEKVKKSKLGLVTHSRYQGDTISKMESNHDVDFNNFKAHDDVHHINPSYDTSKVSYGKKSQKEFDDHLQSAIDIHDEFGPEMYAGTKRHQGNGGHLETYINHTVKSDEEPSHKGLINHISKKYDNMTEKLKTDKAKNAKREELDGHISHIKANKQHYDNLLKMHKHLQNAKNVLVSTLNQHQDYDHMHNGEPANPEGYVFHHNGKTNKLIHRHEFSKRNFLGRSK
jgi:hypothetical protein